MSLQSLYRRIVAAARHGGGVCAALAMLSVSLCGCARADEPWMAIMAPDNSLNFGFYKNNQHVFNLNVGGWGPAWGWRSCIATQKAVDGTLTATFPFEGDKAAGQIINFTERVTRSAPDTMVFRYTLAADRDVPLTMLIAGLSVEDPFKKGTMTFTLADKTTKDFQADLNLITGTGPTSKISMKLGDAGTTTITMDPAVPIAIDHSGRITLAADKFPAGTRTVIVTVKLPGGVRMMASDADMKSLSKVLAGPDWYAFKPGVDVGPSALGFENWLDKPAGKRGIVKMAGEHFVFADGTPVQFWGTNLAYGASAPEKAVADFTAKRFAKWGVNAVRMHKFTGAGWEGIGDPNDATKMDPAGLDRLDYFASQLAANGVYYGWSHTYGYRPKPNNKARLLAYDEIVNNLGGNTYALINFAEDVQDLMIEQVVNLLQHKNPYTGRTYALDPALCYVEMQNEDDIFFYSTDTAVKKCPTYKKALQVRWIQWLQVKYGTTAALKLAWGDALAGAETIEAQNIDFAYNPWFFGEEHLPSVSRPERLRLLDNAAFFHATQNRFYDKFAKAIRATGYKGPLIGSPWQAPSMLPHLYNLKSDAMVGYVDRHDYFGGGLMDTMMGQPGSGMLSMGLQQVAGHPFGVSEWISVYPTLSAAEGPALFAAYGMGLQGWAGSYEFNSGATAAGFSDIVGNFPWGVWNVDVPSQIGQYPVLARMIARGDVKEGPVISTRRVSDTDLAAGNFNYTEHVTQTGDVKSFSGMVPQEALAAGKCLLEFVKISTPSTFPDMTKYKQGTEVRSATGQLVWDTAGKGVVTINTAGTRAVVGFSGGRSFPLGDITIAPTTAFSSLFVTAAEKTTTLANAKTALISAMARTSNTGFTYFTPDNRVTDNGKGPILVEPVKATITFTGRKITAVNVLDHAGKVTGKTLPVTNGSFTIDGATDKTPYYQVVFAD